MRAEIITLLNNLVTEIEASQCVASAKSDWHAFLTTRTNAVLRAAQEIDQIYTATPSVNLHK